MDEQTQQQQQESAGFTGKGFTGDEGGGLDDDFGDDLGSDVLGTGDGSKKKTTAPLVLILVVGLAIGSLFAMHTVTKINASNRGDSEAEQIIDHFVKAMGQGSGPDGQSVDGLVKDHQEILERLQTSYIDEQVTATPRDPFGGPRGGSGGSTGGPTQVASYDYPAAADRLSVKMIIMGSTPLANINGRIVKTNGAVMVALPNKTQVKFRVIDITADTVTVQAEGSDPKEPYTKVLKLNKKRGGRRR